MTEYPRLNKSPFFRTFPRKTAGGHSPGYTIPPPANPALASGVAPLPSPAGHLPRKPVPVAAPSPYPPSAPAQTQTMPEAPETAAKRIHKINQNLPDGVRFEPMDEETKAALMALKQRPPEAAASQEKAPEVAVQKPPQPPAPTVAKTPKITAALPGEALPSAVQLTRFIQDEQNAHTYYLRLAEHAPQAQFKPMLQEIAAACQQRMQQGQRWLSAFHGQEFAPKEAAISPPEHFPRALELALQEEAVLLHAMADMQEKLDMEAAWQFQRQINRRLADQHRLQWMYTAHK